MMKFQDCRLDMDIEKKISWKKEEASCGFAKVS